MGYIRHHAIVVTCFSNVSAERARAKAIELDMKPSEIIETINSYASFFIPPDGSKEGWESSEDGNAKRAAFKSWLINGSSNAWPDWAEVQYGDEGGHQYLVAASNTEVVP